jgi:malonate decarboxylase gamma subunit
MAYDIHSYASLGLLWKTLRPSSASAPTADDVAQVRATLEEALADIASDGARDLSSRFGGEHRGASRRVRELLRAQWNGGSQS